MLLLLIHRSAVHATLHLRRREARLHEARGSVESSCYQHSRAAKDLETQIVAMHLTDNGSSDGRARQSAKTGDKESRTGSDANLLPVVC